MEGDHCGQSLLNRDVMAQILGRVDGPTLAAASCASCDYGRIASEEGLWKGLCHSTWPSTLDEKVTDIISSLPGGFGRFYTNSFPMIIYKQAGEDFMSTALETFNLSSDNTNLVSMVDVFYDGKCIFSKVLYGISGDATDKLRGRWFMDAPFRLHALQYQWEDEGEFGNADEDDMGSLPTVKKMDDRWGRELVHGDEVDGREGVNLSWVMLYTSTGKSVNLSSWKPLWFQSNHPNNGHILLHFGSLVTGEDGQPVECAISVACRVPSRKDGGLECREICMQMVGENGYHIDGKKSLKILNRALQNNCRTRKDETLADMYREYMQKKSEDREKRMKGKYLVNKLFLCICIALIIYFSYLLI